MQTFPMSELNVDLYGRRVGRLIGNRRQFDFVADPDAVRDYGLGSTVLSFAVPLTTSPRPEEAGLRRNFFDEVLAEGKARDRLAANAKIDEENTFSLLRRYGRDVAGAMQVWDPSDPNEPRTPSLGPLTPTGVRQLLAQVGLAPLGNVSVRHLSSLAGVQDKIVLVRTMDGWAEALDGYPSTHIIKPVVGRFPSLIFDEEYGARIVRHLGLGTFDTHIDRFDGVSALVIERYDRGPSGRIHQEDFNQALGFRGDGKYEENGHPGLLSIARVLRDNIGRKAVESLLRMTTLSIAVGNLDMHAKNISVLHLPDGAVELAPMYDVVPQMHLALDKEFAFSVNGKFGHATITRDDIVEEGRRWGIRNGRAIVDDTVATIAEFVREERPSAGAHFALTEDITRFTSNLMNGKGASEGGEVRIADKESREPDANLQPLPQSEGGWGGPVS